MATKSLYAYFGHHKCATVWIHSIMSRSCKFMDLKYQYVHSAQQFKDDLPAYIEDHEIDFITYTNAQYRLINQLKNFRAFHVVRDPRDILVSAYFSHLHTHPTDDWPQLANHRQELENVNKPEGISLEMDFCQGIFNMLDHWDYSHPKILEIKYENLTKTPVNHFKQIFSWLNFDKQIAPEQIKQVVEQLNFSKLAKGREKGQENVRSHFRKGMAGDWKNHFTKRHIKMFKQKYANLLIKLGYEKDKDW